MVGTLDIAKFLRFREDVISKLCQAAEPAGLSLVGVQDSQSSLSRYLTFSTRRGVLCVVRISDHPARREGRFLVSLSSWSPVRTLADFRQWLRWRLSRCRASRASGG
jgi:hypothetical protein